MGDLFETKILFLLRDYYSTRMTDAQETLADDPGRMMISGK